MNKLLIIGAGGHGRSVAEVVLAAKEFEIIGFLDDKYPENKAVWSYPILNNIQNLFEYRKVATHAIVAIGDNMARENMLNNLVNCEFQIPVIIHPLAFVSPSAVIGSGSTIMAGAIIGTESHLGKGVIVNSGAIIDHHCVVEDFGHLGVNTSMAGGSRLGRNAWLQSGSSLGYGVQIDANTKIRPAKNEFFNCV